MQGRCIWAASVVVVGQCFAAQTARGHSRNYGTDPATVKVGGTGIGGETGRLFYQAQITMNIAVTGGGKSTAAIDINDLSAPGAKVTITQWDL